MWMVSYQRRGCVVVRSDAEGEAVMDLSELSLHPLPADPSTSPFSEPDRFQALECLARLHWEGVTRLTILRTLILLANLMNE